MKELELERDSLLKEKTHYLSLENDYEEIQVYFNNFTKIYSTNKSSFQRKLEITKVDYTHGMKALQMDYENKIEIFEVKINFFKIYS